MGHSKLPVFFTSLSPLLLLASCYFSVHQPQKKITSWEWSGVGVHKSRYIEKGRDKVPLCLCSCLFCFCFRLFLYAVGMKMDNKQGKKSCGVHQSRYIEKGDDKLSLCLRYCLFCFRFMLFFCASDAQKKDNKHGVKEYGSSSKQVYRKRTWQASSLSSLFYFLLSLQIISLCISLPHKKGRQAGSERVCEFIKACI